MSLRRKRKNRAASRGGWEVGRGEESHGGNLPLLALYTGPVPIGKKRYWKERPAVAALHPSLRMRRSRRRDEGRVRHRHKLEPVAWRAGPGVRRAYPLRRSTTEAFTNVLCAFARPVRSCLDLCTSIIRLQFSQNNAHVL